MKLSLLLILIFAGFGSATSCRETQKTKATVYPPTKSIEASGERTKPDTISVKSNNQIAGIWESRGKEWETVIITDSQYIKEGHGQTYKYKFTGDSLYLTYFDVTISGKPYLVEDSLFIITQNGILKYIKPKK